MKHLPGNNFGGWSRLRSGSQRFARNIFHVGLLSCLNNNERFHMKLLPDINFGMIQITIMIARICMNHFPEVCIGPRNNPSISPPTDSLVSRWFLSLTLLIRQISGQKSRGIFKGQILPAKWPPRLLPINMLFTIFL